MKSWKLFWLFVIVALCVFESGCALQVASGFLDTAKALPPGFFSNSSKTIPSQASFKIDVDTRESIIDQLGQPKFDFDLKQNREVLAYEKAAVYHFFALKDGVYQQKKEYLYSDVEKDRKAGILELELLKVFECYHVVTPQPTASPPSVSSSPATFSGEIPKLSIR